MAHTKSNIIQSNEYYPFGLQTASSWTRDGSSNTFLANGGTELNTTSALYDLEYRNYDPALARMNQVDPMADKYSSHTPYNFAFNRPNVLTDVDGADPYRSPYMNWHRDENHEGLGFVNMNTISEDMWGGFSGNSFMAGPIYMTANLAVNYLYYNTPYGGSWSDGRVHVFGSDDEAFSRGVAYNDLHNSWAYTEYGSKKGAQFAYLWITATGQIPLAATVEYHMNRAIDGANWSGTKVKSYGSVVGASSLELERDVAKLNATWQAVLDPNWSKSVENAYPVLKHLTVYGIEKMNGELVVLGLGHISNINYDFDKKTIADTRSFFGTTDALSDRYFWQTNRSVEWAREQGFDELLNIFHDTGVVYYGDGYAIWYKANYNRYVLRPK